MECSLFAWEDEGFSLAVEVDEGSSFVSAAEMFFVVSVSETETEAMERLVEMRGLYTLFTEVCQGLEDFTRCPQRFHTCLGARCGGS